MTERPKMTMEIRQQAALEVVDSLISGGHISPSDRENSAGDLARIPTYFDGYEIAKELDSRHGWDCCMDMLESLDAYGYTAEKLLTEKQKRWVAENNIQPPLAIGLRVKYRNGTGVIAGVFEHGPAKYLLKEDDDKAADGPSQRRLIVNFEDVAPA